MIRLSPLLILVAMLVLHDGSQATHAHAPAGDRAELTIPAGHAAHAADGHHDADDDQRRLVESCGTDRLGRGGNQTGEPQSEASADATLPVPSTMDVFGAVSRSQVDHPPRFSPDRLRALYRVYRI